MAARAATMASASGSRAHRVMISSTASGSAATRSAPRRRASSSRASSTVSRSRVQRVGAVGGDQAGELVAAGDQHQAAGRAGQQRADLVGVAGVVQHDRASAGRPAGCGTARPGRPGRPGCAAGGTSRASRNPRTASAGSITVPVGVEAAQVDVQLPVGEPVGDPVGPVHGQGGLADPGGAGDRRDHHRGGLLAGRGQQARRAGRARSARPVNPCTSAGSCAGTGTVGRGRTSTAGRAGIGTGTPSAGFVAQDRAVQVIAAPGRGRGRVRRRAAARRPVRI